jgi:hypothetical protein
MRMKVKSIVDEKVKVNEIVEKMKKMRLKVKNQKNVIYVVIMVEHVIKIKKKKKCVCAKKLGPVLNVMFHYVSQLVIMVIKRISILIKHNYL